MSQAAARPIFAMIDVPTSGGLVRILRENDQVRLYGGSVMTPDEAIQAAVALVDVASLTRDAESLQVDA